jgi:hypothetical protein
MQTAKLTESPDEDRPAFEEGRFSRSVLLRQLDRIIQSKHFRNSKRYPSFLKFVVEQTLAGKTDELKERTLGIDVFSRRNDYDTNADPIVRVTAGEIRKRLAQYYQEPGHEHEVRIDLPLGSYVPHFLPAAQNGHTINDHDFKDEAATLIDVAAHHEQHEVIGVDLTKPTEPKQIQTRRWKRVLLYGLLSLLPIAAVFAGTSLLRNRSQNKGVNYFWHPIVASGNPALIVIGVHTLDNTGQDTPANTRANSLPEGQKNMLFSMIHSDMVPVSDIVSYSKITDLLTRRTHAYRTIGSSDTTFEDLRQGPVILIGGLDNVWTKRLVSSLRYSFFASTLRESEIRDNKNPSIVWKFDNMQLASVNTRDYAIVASYFDPTIEQHVLVVAGIGKSGTVAASEFVTSTQHLNAWLANSKVPPGKNVELVLSTEILDGEPGPPHVVASSIW